MDIKMVWIADPRQREVYVYQSLTELERFTVDDVLPGGEVLPGFNISVAELFGEV
jgi:Uma2 family endonuclease